MSRAVLFLLTIAVGVVAANLYYAQPLVREISEALGIDPAAAGLVVTLTQIGYGLGVLFAVPLVDLIENRRLILSMLSIAIFGLLGLIFADQALPYFAAAFATGLGTSTVQILVPYAAHFASEERRGQVVGSMMSGLMIGIMLSRPLSSFMTSFFGWHAIFMLSAALMTILALALRALLPERRPASLGLRYPSLLASMWTLLKTTPALRERAFYQGCLFGAFCLFWTAVPLYLAGPDFGLSQTGIAVFALAGVSGAVAAPFAGRMADRGHTRRATWIALGAGAFSFVIGHHFNDGLIVERGSSLALMGLLAAAILLDAGVSAHLVLGQRTIFMLPAHTRGRLNGLYIAIIFIGGAAGSTLGAWAYARGGWELTSWAGLTLPALALLIYAFRRKT
ncbi:MAG: MFS transporter [Bdellovibrionaceae bacterium]|nr:MFS transporter [Pseudobdellovibrionaceae bacterium]